MTDAPPTDLVPVSTKAAASTKPPTDLVPVNAGAAASPKPDDKKPSLVSSALKPFADVPRDIFQDVRKGLETSRKAMSNQGGMFNGPQALMGGMEMATAPITGTARALVGDPARKALPNNMFGKVAANTLEDAATMFGPSMVAELGPKITALKGPVRELMDHGVQLTLGQLEPKIAKRMEEAAKSVPILGSFIRSAERRTLDSFNVATVNRSLEPLGIKVDAKNGREAIQKGQEILDKHYADVRKDIKGLHQDSMFDADLQRLRMDLDEMPEGMANRVEAVIQNRVMSKFGYIQSMTGAEFKQAESELSTVANTAKSSADAAERQFGYKIDEVRSALRDALGRQYPAIADKLKEVNHAFSRFADVERAASYRATGESRFTPGDLLQSIKRADKSPRDKQFAAGNRPLQDWAETAHGVIGNKLPDSGTTERAAWDLGGLGAAIWGDPTGAVVPSIAAGSALYSAPGQAMTNTLAHAAPEVAAAVRAAAAKSGPAAAASQAAGQNQ